MPSLLDKGAFSVHFHPNRLRIRVLSEFLEAAEQALLPPAEAEKRAHRRGTPACWIRNIPPSWSDETLDKMRRIGLSICSLAFDTLFVFCSDRIRFLFGQKT